MPKAFGGQVKIEDLYLNFNFNFNFLHECGNTGRNRIANLPDGRLGTGTTAVDHYLAPLLRMANQLSVLQSVLSMMDRKRG